MSRDLYLILVGGGISLASSIVTMFLQHWLGILAERGRLKREEEVKTRLGIREELLRKDIPKLEKLPPGEKVIWLSRAVPRVRKPGTSKILFALQNPLIPAFVAVIVFVTALIIMNPAN